LEDNIYIDDNSLIISDFTWSFSRLNCYYTCPYSAKLQYVDCIKGEDNFFGQFGTFSHKLLERYFKGELSLFELTDEYENTYFDVIICPPPRHKTADIGQNYFDEGYEYFSNFEGFADYEIISVEEKIKFEINGYKFITIPDLIVRNLNKRIEIVDHKSEDLKEPKREFTKVSEKFEEKIRQLYLNSYAVHLRYGEYPEFLNFNIFRKGRWIKHPFNMDEYNDTIKWAMDTIDKYKKETKWSPKSEYYYCSHICNFRNMCDFKG
jgi:hypothetical protein